MIRRPWAAGALRLFIVVMGLAWMGALPDAARAAPYAEMVIDARDGTVLRARNADTRLHPASLTKMMTLYVAFEAVERGEIGLDDFVTVSTNAASEPPSRLGLRAGSRIKVRHLIRAAAVKSANDAATALGEAIGGSETAFVARMNRTAKALGMNSTTFRNANGLTASGHLSTARDMTTLGRHLFYDFPQYYNIFSRQTADAGIKQVSNTNRRLLSSYRGADGIKTGYTNAAGYNLVASAERGGERVIATVFGGASGAARNKRVAELLDLGFQRAPSRVAVAAPARPDYAGQPDTAAQAVAEAVAAAQSVTVSSAGAPVIQGTRGFGSGAGKVLRMSGVVSRSMRPVPAPRGAAAAPATAASDPAAEGERRDAIEALLMEAMVDTGLVPAEAGAATEIAEAPDAGALPEPIPAVLALDAGALAAAEADAEGEEDALEIAAAEAGVLAAMPLPAVEATASSRSPSPSLMAALARPGAGADAAAEPLGAAPIPVALPAPVPLLVEPPQPQPERTVSAETGGGSWRIRLGREWTEFAARQSLVRAVLAEPGILAESDRDVMKDPRGFAPVFRGLSEGQAERACARIEQRGLFCEATPS